MSNRNDQDSIRNQMRSCSSPNTIKHKHINTRSYKYAISRHSLKTCNSTMYDNMSSMHKHTLMVCECVIPNVA